MKQHSHTCVILQSSYIPWRGYFDLVRQADTFIFFDQVQFTRRDWRTRNKILTQNGPQWISVPVKVKDTFNTKIFDVEIDNSQNWNKDHVMTISHSYSKAPYKKEILEVIEPIYNKPPDRLSELNRKLTVALWNCFSSNAPKRFVGDEEIFLAKDIDPNARLISLCKEVGATHYLSGPSAREYIDPTAWEKNGVTISFADYSYPSYSQCQKTDSFEGAISIIDTLMNLGPNCLNEALGIT